MHNIHFLNNVTTVNYKDDGSIESLKSKLRIRRETECYSVINRGLLWYNKLTLEQRIELTNWYNAWLDVTDTLIVPDKPIWINSKLTEQEEIL